MLYIRLIYNFLFLSLYILLVAAISFSEEKYWYFPVAMILLGLYFYIQTILDLISLFKRKLKFIEGTVTSIEVNYMIRQSVLINSKEKVIVCWPQKIEVGKKYKITYLPQTRLIDRLEEIK